ncbi:MAG: preprotein translocase subunit SecE [Armatimonadetes bacterium]|nr:preprotein translocase subunit SecE [Armatimonadota bacterium]
MSEDSNKPIPSAKPAAGAISVPSSKRGLGGFYHELMREMRKVSWPTTKEANRLTGVVLAVCGMMVVMLLVLSTLVDQLMTLITKGGR